LLISDPRRRDPVFRYAEKILENIPNMEPDVLRRNLENFLHLKTEENFSGPRRDNAARKVELLQELTRIAQGWKDLPEEEFDENVIKYVLQERPQFEERTAKKYPPALKRMIGYVVIGKHGKQEHKNALKMDEFMGQEQAAS
jgi:hypothetical protein